MINYDKKLLEEYYNPKNMASGYVGEFGGYIVNGKTYDKDGKLVKQGFKGDWIVGLVLMAILIIVLVR